MAEAEKTLGELQRQSKVAYISPYMIAVIYSGLDQREKAFEFLEKAYEERSPDAAYFVKTDRESTRSARTRAFAISCTASDCRSDGTMD
jgi:hypothetical protein